MQIRTVDELKTYDYSRMTKSMHYNSCHLSICMKLSLFMLTYLPGNHLFQSYKFPIAFPFYRYRLFNSTLIFMEMIR
jgi:hypothetical protein